MAFVTYIKETNSKLLDYKVKAFLRDNGGHKILWTPPYCPELQPIELFWAAGKNHVAKMFNSKITMKKVVQHLREG